MTLDQLVPWLAVIVIFVGMVALDLYVFSWLGKIAILVLGGKPPAPTVLPTTLADELAKLKQAIAAAAKPPAPVAPPPVPLPTPAHPGEPPWYTLALKDVGFHEVGDNRGIEKFAIGAKIPVEQALGQPWCATALNCWLETAGVPGTKSMSSQSFTNSPLFVKLDSPAIGCIVVFWRGNRESGLGHVGLYVSETGTSINTLGGNESDGVRIEALPKSSASFGLVGYYWPKGYPLPTGGSVPAPSTSLTYVANPPPPPSGLVNSAIVIGKMSVFGGPNDTGVSPSEGLALCEQAEVDKFPGLFLPTQPPGTTGVARRLDPTKAYIAMRWDYKQTSRSYLQGITVKVAANGKTLDARPIDWGPAASTGRICDMSPGLATALGLKTDDTCTVTIPLAVT